MIKEDESIFDIDEYQLHKEWLKQPKLYRKYASLLAEARMEVAIAKTNIDMVEAELDSEVRMHPTNYGVEGRVTENSIASCILKQKSHKEAVAKHIQAKYKQDSLEALVNSLEHRKKALEHLVTLKVHDFYAEPREPRGEDKEKTKELFKKSNRSKGALRRQAEGE